MSAFADFDNGEPVYRVTRAQLIDDGVPVDVSGLYPDDVAGRGIACHVAMTATAYAAAVWPIDDQDAADVLEKLGESNAPRMRRVLAAYVHTVRRQGPRVRGNALPIAVAVAYAADDVREIDLKVLVGPGDAGEMVVTILLPNED